MEGYRFTPANVGQPAEIRAQIPSEDEKNKVEINQAIDKLRSNNELIESDIKFLSRLLSSRNALKYVYDEKLIAQVLTHSLSHSLSHSLTHSFTRPVILCLVWRVEGQSQPTFVGNKEQNNQYIMSIMPQDKDPPCIQPR